MADGLIGHPLFYGAHSVFPDESVIDSVPEQHMARDHIHRSSGYQFSSPGIASNFLKTGLAYAGINGDHHCAGAKCRGLL